MDHSNSYIKTTKGTTMTIGNINLVLLGDSYKYGHGSQMPENVISQYDYIAARHSKEYDEVVFFGLQYYLNILTTSITSEDVLAAADMADAHGIPFDIKGWLYIARKLDGKLPIKIKALPEGTVAPLGVPLVVVESTDENVPWVTGWVETLLLKIWYPCTVATHARSLKKILCERGDPAWAEFALHMFGDRASSSVASAAIAGMAHLTQFKGTDNFNALQTTTAVYESSMPGYSVYATEHSTTTMNGPDGEEEFVYTQLLANPDKAIMSFVADSYDVYNFVNFCTHPGSRIRKLIESRPHQKLVLRPDSGDPIIVIGKMLDIMLRKGNNVRRVPHPDGKDLMQDFAILWGDGIGSDLIETILREADVYNVAAENFVFGMGGNLVHAGFNRDTLGFAMKCSSISVIDPSVMLTSMPPQPKVNEIDVFKDPITDPSKASIKGRMTTITNHGVLEVCLERDVPSQEDKDIHEALIPVFENGEILKTYTFAEVRENCKV